MCQLINLIRTTCGKLSNSHHARYVAVPVKDEEARHGRNHQERQGDERTVQKPGDRHGYQRDGHAHNECDQEGSKSGDPSEEKSYQRDPLEQDDDGREDQVKAEDGQEEADETESDDGKSQFFLLTLEVALSGLLAVGDVVDFFFVDQAKATVYAHA